VVTPPVIGGPGCRLGHLRRRPLPVRSDGSGEGKLSRWVTDRTAQHGAGRYGLSAELSTDRAVRLCRLAALARAGVGHWTGREVLICETAPARAARCFRTARINRKHRTKTAGSSHAASAAITQIMRVTAPQDVDSTCSSATVVGEAARRAEHATQVPRMRTFGGQLPHGLVPAKEFFANDPDATDPVPCRCTSPRDRAVGPGRPVPGVARRSAVAARCRCCVASR
jgi:hypothetical protein